MIKDEVIATLHLVMLVPRLPPSLYIGNDNRKIWLVIESTQRS